MTLINRGVVLNIILIMATDLKTLCDKLAQQNYLYSFLINYCINITEKIIDNYEVNKVVYINSDTVVHITQCDTVKCRVHIFLRYEG